MKKILIALLCQLVYGVSSAQAPDSVYTITGTFAGAAPPSIHLFNFYNLPTGTYLLSDSARVENGHFSISGKVPRPALAMIWGGSEYGGVQLFYLKGGRNYTFNSSGRIIDAVIKGGDDIVQPKYRIFQQGLFSIDSAVALKNELYTAAMGKKDTALARKISGEILPLRALKNKRIDSFIRKYNDSDIGWELFRQRRNMYRHVLDVEPFFKSLSERLQTGPEGRALSQEMERVKRSNRLIDSFVRKFPDSEVSWALFSVRMRSVSDVLSVKGLFDGLSDRYKSSPEGMMMNYQFQLEQRKSGEPPVKPPVDRDAVAAEISRRNPVIDSFILANNREPISWELFQLRRDATANVLTIENLFAGLDQRWQSSPEGMAIAKEIESEKAKLNKDVIDFTLNSPEEKPVTLSSFHGRYVLVDFWASWCGPCRAENPNVVKAYQRFHPKGLEILSVSIDDKRNLWLKGIEEDKLPWYQVIDNGKVAKLYGIHSIPQNILVSPDGKVIARNLRGEDLQKGLSRFLE